MRKWRSSLILLAATPALTLTLAGCWSLAPHYERPPIELPGKWAGPDGRSAADIGAKWWTVFDDKALDRLVEEALTNNANLALAVARVDEARALLGLARGDQFPTVDAQLDRSRSQSSLGTNIPLPPSARRVSDDYRATLNVSYELDLWGRYRDASAAARADLLATEAARDTVRIALAADVTRAYFALHSLDEQLEATRRSLATRREALSLQKMRYDVGALSEFEYRQIEAEVLAAQAQLPVLENRRSQQEGALAVLLGRSARAIYEDTVVEKSGAADGPAGDPPIVVVPGGLPSQLLLRRPDLIESEQHLIAANFRIGVARADYFPSISLTGFFGNESTLLSDLFTGPTGIWRAGASAAQSIFSVGSQADVANARQRQALAQYRQAIQNAFRDVRDAIVTQNKSREQFDAESRRVAALRDALRLARLRYENGISSQLDVLDSERNLLAAELNRSDALRAQRAAVADLFKALGGGWREKP